MRQCQPEDPYSKYPLLNPTPTQKSPSPFLSFQTRPSPLRIYLIPYYDCLHKLIFKYHMTQTNSSLNQSSLEENLTNSIRRAKEKIYNHSLNTYSILNEFNLEPEPARAVLPSQETKTEGRHRAGSQRTYSQGGASKEEGNALAGAMKSLQERIAMLEKEKQNDKQPQNREVRKEGENRLQRDMTKLVSSLKERQHQLNKLSRKNSDLDCKNVDLLQRISQLQEQLQRTTRKTETLQNQFTSSLESQSQRQAFEPLSNFQHHHQLLTEKDLRIAELQSVNKQWQTRNELSHQTIQKLMRQLEQQKKTNIRWIKLHDEQLKFQQKQNNSLEINQTERKAKIRQSEAKKDYSQLLRNNKEMFENIQRNKSKIIEMSRQMKQSEERYAKLKLLVNEIIQNINKILPHPNTHIRFLMNRIQKLESIHLESLRSFSNLSRRSIVRNSHSNQRKKSLLKMEDLNSSSNKKSQERSAGKSSRKRKIQIQPMSHSDKKFKIISEEEQQIETLEKEVVVLKRQHRNLVVKAEKNNNSDKQLGNQIEETTMLYVTKKNRLDELRRNSGALLSNLKKQPLMILK